MKPINNSWDEILKEEISKPYFEEIRKEIVKDINLGETVYPELNRVFEAFKLTPFENVEVVILG
ncbi:MAG: uracil-DNA glycosylase, partial [Candidatus Gracilibacteria bacterium]|nr:uracil-DNA glycosylase [Candidatus Gracilibacteria bacterium]